MLLDTTKETLHGRSQVPTTTAFQGTTAHSDWHFEHTCSSVSSQLLLRLIDHSSHQAIPIVELLDDLKLVYQY